MHGKRRCYGLLSIYRLHRGEKSGIPLPLGAVKCRKRLKNCQKTGKKGTRKPAPPQKTAPVIWLWVKSGRPPGSALQRVGFRVQDTERIVLHDQEAAVGTEDDNGGLQMPVAAKTAAFVSKESFIVSIKIRSAPYFAPNFTVWEKIFTASSKSRSP